MYIQQNLLNIIYFYGDICVQIQNQTLQSLTIIDAETEILPISVIHDEFPI